LFGDLHAELELFRLNFGEIILLPKVNESINVIEEEICQVQNKMGNVRGDSNVVVPVYIVTLYFMVDNVDSTDT
jgi:hypothetical protein